MYKVIFISFCVDGDGHVLLPSTTNQIQVLVKQAHMLAFDVVFSQLKQKLIEIPKLKVQEITIGLFLVIITHTLSLPFYFSFSFFLSLSLSLSFSFSFSLCPTFLSPPPFSLSHKVWSRSTSSPLESPQALTDDLPSFSLSPLTYITEVITSPIGYLCFYIFLVHIIV